MHFLKHIITNINTMQIALVLYYVSPKLSFSQNLGHLMQILISLLNSYDRLVGEQQKLYLFYLVKTDPLKGANDRNILP